MRQEEPYDRLIKSGAVPLARIGRPEEIAGAALYLASRAASYTIGDVLIVMAEGVRIRAHFPPACPPTRVRPVRAPRRVRRTSWPSRR
jgi:Enoyl-(Acyl carrier protein) reductase